MTYKSDQAMSASGPSHKHLYAANQMNQRAHSDGQQPVLTTRAGYSAASSDHIKQMAHQAETPTGPVMQNLPTPLAQNLATNPLSPEQAPMTEHSSDSHPTPVPSFRPGSSSWNTTASNLPSQGLDTLRNSMACPEPKVTKTSKETQQQTLTPAGKVSRTSNDQVDFNWQAPEFNRKSEEVVSLILETQEILGMQKLNQPWIISAHVFIIAADAIDGDISETTLHILQLGYLKSLKNKPDNPLENVSQEMAKVVNDWYEQSEEDKIETEYFELLNSINRYRKAKNRKTFHKRTSYKRVLKEAADIINHERQTQGTDHLPPKHERANLTEYIQNALEFMHSDEIPLSNS